MSKLKNSIKQLEKRASKKANKRELLNKAFKTKFVEDHSNTPASADYSADLGVQFEKIFGLLHFVFEKHELEYVWLELVPKKGPRIKKGVDMWDMTIKGAVEPVLNTINGLKGKYGDWKFRSCEDWIEEN